MNRKKLIAAILASAFLLALMPNTSVSAAGPFPIDPGFDSLLGGRFITREIDRLYEGDGRAAEYRFLGLNWQALLANWQQAYPGWSYVYTAKTEAAWQYELEDAVRSTAQMGATVMRMHALNIAGREGEYILTTQGSSQYNAMAQEDTWIPCRCQECEAGTTNHGIIIVEANFRKLDWLLAMGHKYGVRVFWGLIDGAQATGGPGEWTHWKGLGGGGSYDAGGHQPENGQFYTDQRVITPFLQFVSYVANRENAYTGLVYKDDPAIFCWESGNEINRYNYNVTNAQLADWTSGLAAYMKEDLEVSQLFMDGSYTGSTAVSGTNMALIDRALDDANIDIISNHYYWTSIGLSSLRAQGVDEDDAFRYVAAFDADYARGKKPFVVGEYGAMGGGDPMNHVGKLYGLLEGFEGTGAAGALIWSASHRSYTGGFYWHPDFMGTGANDSGYSYHWPGFPYDRTVGIEYEEAKTLRLIRETAYALRGLTLPPVEIPDAPYLFDYITPDGINWRGSTGASSYNVERATAPGGPWTVVGARIHDAVYGYDALFADRAARPDTDYWYRVTALSDSGQSPPSNVIGPVSKADPYRNLITGGDFEGLTTENSGAWVLTPPWEITDAPAAADANHDPGNRSAKVEGTAAGWETLYQIINVEPNTDYVLSMWINAGSYVSIAVNDPNSAMTGIVSADYIYDPGIWAFHELKFNSGSRTQVAAAVHFTWAEDEPWYHPVYVDDVAVRYTPPAEPDPDEEFVVNGGFEDGAAGWTLAPWEITSGAGLGDAVYDPGGYAISVASAGSWGSAYQQVSVSPDTDYSLTFWAKCDAGFWVTVGPNDSGVWWDWDDKITALETNASNEWERYTLNFNSGSNNSVWIILYDTAAAGGTNYVDGVSVKLQPPDPDWELVRNGDFESGSSFWTIPSAGNWEVVSAAGQGDLSYDPGAQCITIAALGNWNRAATEINVRRNTDYILTLWAKGTAQLTFGVLLEPNGSLWGTNFAQETPGGSWRQLELRFNSGGNDSLWVLLFDSGSGADIYVDGVSVKYTPPEPVLPPDATIRNGDLELGDDGNWVLSSNAISIITVSSDSGAAADSGYNPGVYCAVIDSATGWPNMSQNVGVERNTDYILSFWAKCASRLYYGAFTKGHSHIRQLLAGPSGEWTYYEIEFNSGSLDEIAILIGDEDNQSGAKNYIDGISLRKNQSQPGPGEFITNRGFETRSFGLGDGGEVIGWQFGTGASAVSDAPGSAGRSARLTGAGASVSQQVGAAKYIELNRNRDYILTFRAYGSPLAVLINAGAILSGNTVGGTSWREYEFEFSLGNNTGMLLSFTLDSAGESFVENVSIRRMADEEDNNVYADNFFIVSFDSKSDIPVSSVLVWEYGVGSTLYPPAVSRDGYILEGWYTEDSLITKWNFNNPVARDMTLYAKWEAVGSSGPGDGDKNGNTSPSPQQPYRPPAQPDPQPDPGGDSAGLPELERVYVTAGEAGEEVALQAAEAVSNLAAGKAAANTGIEVSQIAPPITVSTGIAAPAVAVITAAQYDDTAQITTMAVLNEDGTLTAVPTRIDSDGRIVALVSGDVTLVPLRVKAGFTDTDFGPQFAHVTAEIDLAASLMLIEGIGNGLFDPASEMTVQAFVTVLLRAIGVPVGWETAMDIAAQRGLIDGDSADPNAAVTRIDAAAMLLHTLSSLGLRYDLAEDEAGELLAAYADLDGLTAQQRKDMAICVKLGIFHGAGGGMMNPHSALLRSQLASLATRMQNVILNISIIT